MLPVVFLVGGLEREEEAKGGRRTRGLRLGCLGAPVGLLVLLSDVSARGMKCAYYGDEFVKHDVWWWDTKVYDSTEAAPLVIMRLQRRDDDGSRKAEQISILSLD
jgi:hypothetical protein